MKTKLLTEKQAWLKIARAFEKYHKIGISKHMTEAGLGLSIVLAPTRTETFKKMAAKIDQTFEDFKPYGKFLFPNNRSYAKHRADLCRKFAKECR